MQRERDRQWEAEGRERECERSSHGGEKFPLFNDVQLRELQSVQGFLHAGCFIDVRVEFHFRVGV